MHLEHAAVVQGSGRHDRLQGGLAPAEHHVMDETILRGPGKHWLIFVLSLKSKASLNLLRDHGLHGSVTDGQKGHYFNLIGGESDAGADPDEHVLVQYVILLMIWASKHLVKY